jgi:hypothetical protein
VASYNYPSILWLRTLPNSKPANTISESAYEVTGLLYIQQIITNIRVDNLLFDAKTSFHSIHIKKKLKHSPSTETYQAVTSHTKQALRSPKIF